MSERPHPQQQPQSTDKTTPPREDKIIKTEINGRTITPPSPAKKGVKELWY